MIAWGRSGEQVTREMTRLPDRLTEAEEAFRAALADEALKPLAHTGIAWVIYLNASSPRSSYAPADCAALHNAIEAAGPDPGPQSHFWEASCNRKLGDRLKALQGYARVLTEASPNGEPVVANLPRRDDADLTLEMNALHGVGTQLIATYNASDRIVADALAMASTRCSPGSPVRVDPMAATLSDRMVLARKCLERAIDVRRQLGQTQNERSGSQENISFAYLREGDFKGAFDNAQAVTATGYFAWNELVRALSAEKLLEGNDAKGDVRVALGEARRAVRFFRVAEFNPCELPVLLDDALFAAANQIVTEEHEGEGLTCDTARPG
jgi:tetratricopeptide (TPR) repeat protein